MKSGSWSRVKRPNLLKRAKFWEQSFDVLDVHGTYSRFMNDMYELAEDEDWDYTKRKPKIPVYSPGVEKRAVNSLGEIEMLQRREVDFYPDSHRWRPEISSDEFGPIESINLLYVSGSNGRKEGIGSKVEARRIDSSALDELIDIMESNFGEEEEVLYEQ